MGRPDYTALTETPIRQAQLLGGSRSIPAYGAYLTGNATITKGAKVLAYARVGFAHCHLAIDWVSPQSGEIVGYTAQPTGQTVTELTWTADVIGSPIFRVAVVNENGFAVSVYEIGYTVVT